MVGSVAGVIYVCTKLFGDSRLRNGGREI
jgi:hypothetical protein